VEEKKKITSEVLRAPPMVHRRGTTPGWEKPREVETPRLKTQTDREALREGLKQGQGGCGGDRSCAAPARGRRKAGHLQAASGGSVIATLAASGAGA